MHQTLENRKFSKQFVKSNEAIKGGKAVSLVLHFFPWLHWKNKKSSWSFKPRFKGYSCESDMSLNKCLSGPLEITSRFL